MLNKKMFLKVSIINNTSSSKHRVERLLHTRHCFELFKFLNKRIIPKPLRYVTSLPLFYNGWNWDTETSSQELAEAGLEPSWGLCSWRTCLLRTQGGSALCCGWMGAMATEEGGRPRRCSPGGQRDQGCASVRALAQLHSRVYTQAHQRPTSTQSLVHSGSLQHDSQSPQSGNHPNACHLMNGETGNVLCPYNGILSSI